MVAKYGLFSLTFGQSGALIFPQRTEEAGGRAGTGVPGEG